MAVGPAVTVTLAATDMAKIVVSPDGRTAVANFGEGALAWNTQTGAELWRQEADDKDIDPLMITPGVSCTRRSTRARTRLWPSAARNCST